MLTESNIEEVKPTTVSSTEIRTNQEIGVIGLIKYSLFRIFKCFFFERASRIERASRGEYILFILAIYTIFETIVTIVNIFDMWGTFIDQATLIGVIIFYILFLNINIGRVHDLGKSQWFLFPVIVAPISIIVGGIGFMSMILGGKGVLFRIIGVPFAIWLLGVLVFLCFVKGSIGDNKYGPDRLLQQPSTNGIYWITGFILVATLFIVRYIAAFVLSQGITSF